MSDTEKNNSEATDQKEEKTVAPAAPAETKNEKTEEPKTAVQTKTPMDPKRKKQIIIWCSVGGVVAVALIVAAILIPILTSVDYKESYALASELNSAMSDFYYDYDDCVDVVDDANDDWVSVSTYSSYISDCKDALKPTTLELVKKLSNASGVQRDDEVKFVFNKFATEFNKAIVSVDDNLNSKLDVYDNWHKFIYNIVDMSFYSNNASKITTYADYAINSGNDTLKAFGEEWKTKALDVASAYKAYDDATSNYSGLYETFTTKRDELDDWVDENLPDITTIIPLSFEDNAWEIDDAWEDVYDVIYAKFLRNGASSLINTTPSTTTDYEKILEDLLK